MYGRERIRMNTKLSSSHHKLLVVELQILPSRIYRIVGYFIKPFTLLISFTITKNGLPSDIRGNNSCLNV
jgi:hypothetical protein